MWLFYDTRKREFKKQLRSSLAPISFNPIPHRGEGRGNCPRRARFALIGQPFVL
jgi:hypothetical protein